VQADARRLPFADRSIDVVFANMLLPWIDDPLPLFVEVARVLRKGGLFSFATLGPDSLSILRRAWETAAPGSQHVNRFSDMHDVGDSLVSAGLVDPVLDVDRLTLSYSSADNLFRDLTAAGGRNSLAAREKSLLGKHRYQSMRSALCDLQADDKINVEMELVYGHCWGSGQSRLRGEFRIDAAQIAHRNTIQ
jgi:malonyl-CoA O-methyltransferase